MTIRFTTKIVVQNSKRLAFAATYKLGNRQREGERAQGQAGHGDHQRQPAGVAARALVAHPAADGERKHGGNRSRKEEAEADAEELAGVWLHRAGNREQGTGNSGQQQKKKRIPPLRCGMTNATLRNDERKRNDE